MPSTQAPSIWFAHGSCCSGWRASRSGLSGEWWNVCAREDGLSMKKATGAWWLRWIRLTRHAASYDRTWRAGEWWTSRGYDPSFGRKLPTLFERCGLTNIRHEATAEVVRGDSQWASWWQQTLEAIRTWEQANGDLSQAREKEYETLTAPWSDPSFLFLNSLRHVCWGQRQ